MASPVYNASGAGHRKVWNHDGPAGDTGNLTAATGANTDAVLGFNADAGGLTHRVAGIYWSYSGTPTGGRLTIATPAGNLVDLDITAGGPGFLPFDPPLNCGPGWPTGSSLAATTGGTGSATVKLYAGGAGVTGKVMAHVWRS